MLSSHLSVIPKKRNFSSLLLAISTSLRDICTFAAQRLPVIWEKKVVQIYKEWRLQCYCSLLWENLLSIRRLESSDSLNEFIEPFSSCNSISLDSLQNPEGSWLDSTSYFYYVYPFHQSAIPHEKQKAISVLGSWALLLIFLGYIWLPVQYIIQVQNATDLIHK